jgi:hypothetical protein
MAKTKNPLWAFLDIDLGELAKDYVVKTRNGKAFIAKKPDMSNVKRSRQQKRSSGRFADAVAFARDIINDPVKKATYKVRPGTSVYHSAIKDYVESH